MLKLETSVFKVQENECNNRCNNISSHGFFSLFIITFCTGFTRTEKKYVKVTDDDICNRKTEFQAKSGIMKMNIKYKKVEKKIWKYGEFLNIKRQLHTVIFFTKFDWYNSAFESLFFRSVGAYFFCKLWCLQWKTALPLSRNKFLLSIGASLVGKAGFSLKHGKMWHIFQQSKIKIIK